MDAKITKTRLSRMLSYDWWKIVAIAVALIFVWTLVFTMTATRILPSQDFTVCNYMGNVTFSNGFNDNYGKAVNSNAFSFETIEWGTEDFALNSSEAYQLLPARIATEELDVMFVSMQGVKGKEIETPEGEAQKYSSTYLTDFLIGYRFNLHKADEYLAQMQAYVDKYYDADGKLDEGKIEKDFRARAKANKDKRYKKEADIVAGVRGEIDRVKKYTAALDKFNDYLARGLVELTTTTYTDEKNESYSFSGVYSINLCPSSNTEAKKISEKLSSIVGYETTYVDENGKTQKTVSAIDMNICLFNLNGGEEAYRYEGMLYVVHVLDSIHAA